MIAIRTVGLSDLLLLFIYLEVIAMVHAYWHIGREIVVIGGGNVAYDVARTVLRQIAYDTARTARAARPESARVQASQGDRKSTSTAGPAWRAAPSSVSPVKWSTRPRQRIR